MATLTFHGNLIHTSGELPPVGTTAPDFSLTDGQLHDVSLRDFAGKRKVLNIVPSLDTPVCAASTRKFNEKASRFDNLVVLVISADLPFAQGRFCETEGLRNVISLSTFRSNFGEVYGVKIIEGLLAGLMARAVVIIDEHDVVRYTQWVYEITEEPNYDDVLVALA